MTEPNPYAPPVDGPPSAAATTPGDFVPLRLRTQIASVAVWLVPACGLAMDAIQLAYAGDLAAKEPPLGPSLLLLAAAVGTVGSTLVGAIAFCVWVHRAASNLRGLGRWGMEYTPGWCVGWFFIPFANLVKPSSAVGEIWRASEPDAVQGDWVRVRPSPMIRAWWAPWIIGSLLANVSGRTDDAKLSGGVGLVANLFLAAAAYGCVMLMRDIERRQDEAARVRPVAIRR